MTFANRKVAVALTMASAAVALSAPAFAASVDYFLKIDGVEGESTEAAGSGNGHKDWIELTSLRLAGDTSPGGVNVAAGDVNGDGAAGASARSSAPRTYEPIRLRKRIDKSPPAQVEPAPTQPSAPPAVASGETEETAALLLPAVQKVREAAARVPAWAGCTVGQQIPDMRIMQKSTGRTGRIRDATVSNCASEQVSFNFTKIEWD